MKSPYIMLTALLFCFSLAIQVCAADYVWIEGEAPDALPPAGTASINGWGPKEALSGGKWLSISLKADEVDKLLPDDGLPLSYTFTAPRDATYALWMHLGYEAVRAPFDWRMDNGDWKTVGPEAPTVDVQELALWCPVAWMPLGEQPLSAGAHTLTLRVKKVKDAEGKFAACSFAIDAFCLDASPFHPDGNIQPGDSAWMTEADKAAAAHNFPILAGEDPAQQAISLKGEWQYAGDDEMTVADRLGPVKALPTLDALHWHAIAVPSDRNVVMPSETYVHRFYYRTRFEVPAGLSHRSFVLRLSGPSVIATVFVNGQRCGWTKNSFTLWDCDITAAVKPGAVNELCLAFKDAFYALNGTEKTHHPQYAPYSFWHFKTTGQLDLPILVGERSYQAGILLGDPELIVGGASYTADVFAIPSVKTHALGLEITLHNPGDTPATLLLSNEIVPLHGGAVAKRFTPRLVIIPAGADLLVKLSEPWPDARLWWPDDPWQYNVVTRLALDGKVIDARTTKFGFREWSWDGPEFKLNGIPFHGFSDADTLDIARMKVIGQSMKRIWWQNADTEAYQNACDAQGMPVRRTGTFDGQGVGGFYDVHNEVLWDNYREQMVAWIKGLRNHPSIFIWSIENEISFINGHVFGNDAVTTREQKKTWDLLSQVDPTRPVMPDGGNAELDESLPVYGVHYFEPPVQTYPESIYDKAGYAHRQVWPITQQKPILAGEAAWGGDEAAQQATIGGDVTFLGGAAAAPATAMSLRMLSEGYRWLGINFCFWTLTPDFVHKAWQPVAILSRQWGWSFGSGQQVTRTLGIFNATRYDDPITFTWTLTVGGKKVAGDSTVYQIAAGYDKKFVLQFKMPVVSTREEGVFAMTLLRGGKIVFQDSKALSVLPTLKLTAPLPSLAVYDPQGNISTFLSGAHIPFTAVKALDDLPAVSRVLLIGRDALSAQQAGSSALAAWAAAGRAVIVLEQQHPLQYQALPGQMASESNHGCIAFAEDSEGPLFHGLKQADLFCWGQDNYLYRDAYQKPVSGGKSIIQCDLKLADAALVEMQAGQGVLLLSQLLIGEKIADNVVAQQLLLNLLQYAASYQLRTVPATVVSEAQAPLRQALDTIGLQYRTVDDPLAALAPAGGIAVIDATPAHLRALATHLAAVRAFTDGGGWIILNNLTPEGLADYNTLVGVPHVIRPFGREKVTWPAVRSPLTAGLSSSNIVFGTGSRIMWFRSVEWPDVNGYSYVVDLDDAAPFAKSSYYGWGNAVNNFTQADGAWQLIQNLAPKDAVMPITLAQPEKILRITWVSDNNYQGTTKIAAIFNDKTYTFATLPNGDPQTFDIPDQPTASALTIKVLDWTHDAAKLTKDGQELVGIDNVTITVARPPVYADRVKPLLNIGAMVAYPHGKGGIILCNIKFRPSEENPLNMGKKQTVLATLLRNLHAPFTGGKSIIAGAGNLQCRPIDLSKQANQFRGDRGWFGDPAHTFADIPSGAQTFAGIDYNIYHLTTSIVPEAVMLGGKGIPGNLPDAVTGIPVHMQADALFFLHIARLDKRRSAKEVTTGKQYEMADYLIHYADGQVLTVPVYAEIDIDDYRQPVPLALPGAQLAWSKPYPDTICAVAYAMQWNNPRPAVAIDNIDLRYGPDRRGVPVLLAVTAAVAP